MDKLEEVTEIKGKVVRCILIFDKYNERSYRKDFNDFLNYQKKVSLTGEKTELVHPFYYPKEFTFIPYGLFKEYSIRFFSRVVFSLLRDNTDFMISNELNIQIKFIRVKNWSYSFETDDEAFDPENACFHAAGTWFIQYIVAPFFYFRHIEFGAITGLLKHELTHYVDIVNKYLSWDINANYEKKIKLRARKKSAYCLNYLYNSMFNLREEGLADFYQRKDSPKIDINMEGIWEYNRNMGLLANLRLKKDAERFYQKNIGWDNLTPSGEYTVGRNMCLFIALYSARIIKLPYTIQAGKDTYSGYEFKNLDSLLSSNKVIYISNLSKEVIEEAIRLIRPTAHYYFLKLYEQACNGLGISDENRAMTQKRFYRLTRTAIASARAEKSKKLKKAGFAYEESDDGYEMAT
jgi:hypothetical protein